MDYFRNKSIETLRWIEGYTKTDMVYLAKGGFWTFSSQIIISLGTFLLAVAFAHFAPKETYGEYKYILSISTILGTLTLTGIGNAVMNSVVLGYEGTLKYAFWQNIKWSLLSSICALGASFYYYLNQNFSLAISLIVIGILSPLWSSTNLYDSYLAAKKDFKRSAIYFGIIGNIIPSACLFVTILFTTKPWHLILVYFLANTIVGYVLYKRIISIYKPNDKVDTGIINYSKHLSAIKILGVIANNIDQILVFHYLGPIQLAIYNFALALPSQIKGPIKGIATIALPKFTEREDSEIRTGMKNKYLFVFLFSLVIIIFYVVLSPIVFKIFFPKYLESVLYSQILSLSLLSLISIPVEIYFVAKERIKEQYIANVSYPLIQVVVMFIFVTWLGLMGIVIAKVLMRVLWSIINIALFEKYSHMNPKMQNI